MTTIHETFLCSHEHVQHFGGRRRRCRDCRKTWRVHQRRRGRRVHSRAIRLLDRTLRQGLTATQIAAQARGSVATIRYRLSRLLNREMQLPAPAPPPGPYVMLGDGLWFRFAGVRYVLYLLALKPLDQDRAYFLDPILLKGRECLEAWGQVIATIPFGVPEQVRAFVSDGLRGLSTLAGEQGWLHQRCHFHLIAQLELQRGRRLHDPRERLYRDQVILTVRKMLRVRSQMRLKELTGELEAQLRSPWCTKRLGAVCRDFIRELPDFRTYLTHLDLNLPTTTGTIESMNSLLRDRLNKLNSPAALARWAICFVRAHPSLCCRGFRSKRTPNS